MELDEETNNESLNKLNFIVRASISINLEDTGIVENLHDISVGDILKDMYDTLSSNNKNPNVNYLGLWAKVDGEIYENSIKLEVLDQIDKFSAEKVNNLFEFLSMTIPD